MILLRRSSYIMTTLAGLTLSAQGQVDTARARRGLEEFDRACVAATAIWNGPICGPVLLVDPATRLTITNRKPPTGSFTKLGAVFVGQLPDEIGLANTSQMWGGELWAMVLLPLSRNPHDRVGLIAHESYHRLQSERGWITQDLTSPHLVTRDGRLWFRLELQALAYALTTNGSASREHARNAMLFRQVRYEHFPDAARRENALEYAEGLAEYTGQRVALASTNLGVLRTIEQMRGVEQQPSLARSFAYATGPAIGLLLDRFAPTWRSSVHKTRAPGAQLMSALRPIATPDSAALRRIGEPYGYTRIANEENEKELAAIAQRTAYIKMFVEGPVIILRQMGLRRSFNPNNLVPMDSLGTVYPTGQFGADWGTLAVDSGGLLAAPDFKMARIAAPPGITDGATKVVGAGWVLQLAPGWILKRGTRPGDWELARP